MINNLMSKEYRVLARKYRPQKFEDLIGQETIVHILTNSITNNRVAHAYLLTGVRGIGKTTTARLIAMALNCESRINDSSEPCEKCNSCISIKDDRNIDVMEMDAASKTGVDDIREIIDNVKYKPVSNKYKIFIIDEVHMLSKNAFNALLKTLEEPPPHVKFIFATTEVKKIPITIISRCQRLDLLRIENAKLTSYLFLIAKKESVSINEDAMALIVRAADGSVRDGLSLLDQAIVNENGTISLNTVTVMLGLADRGQVFDLMDTIFKGDAALSLKIFAKIYQSGADILTIFDEMLKITHFITQLKISPEIKNDIHIPELERTHAANMSQNLSMSSLGIFWQVLFKGYQELQNGYHIYHLAEMIIIRLIYLYDGPSPSDLIKNLEKKIETTTSLNSNENKSSENSKVETTSYNKNFDSNENINKVSSINSISINSFRHFVDLFYQHREGMLHTYLYNSVKLISFKEGDVVINVEKISDPNFTRTIANYVSKWTARIWKVTNSNSNLGKSLQEEDIINQQAEIELMQNDSDVKSILDKFPGVKIHSITPVRETSDENAIAQKQKKLKGE